MQIPSSAVQESLTRLTDSLDEVLDETVRLCRIPAPTFEEAERAAYVAERMRALGLTDVRIDSINNVTGILSAGTPGPTTLVAAHLDTVFPRATPLHIRHTRQRLYGPGIGDNCVAVAAMLSVAAAMRHLQPLPSGRVIFAASVGEEGLGNLCGIRALLETWHGQVDTVLAVEGHGIDEVRSTGIGSTRLEVTFTGPGGHSWGAFGTPSAIHAMGSAIHQIARLQVPQDPKTTFNVGIVEGGGSVNTIAPRATMLVDLRSLDPAQLTEIENRVDRLFQDVHQDTGVQVTSRIVGRRPAAALATDHPLCCGVNDIRHYLRLRPALFSAASTDANLPLSLGIPAVCLGITRGALAHTVQEYIDTAPVGGGLQQLLLTILHAQQSDWHKERAYGR
ncbi:MAG TPA: M20/M25/M40 family metallo-hydrolase [Candidatus Tectomicrobia bacterium]